MAIDFVLRNARLPHALQPTDIGVEGGLIAVIEPGFACDAPEYDAGGRLVCGGLIESHIHLDKAGIIGRCSICAGTLAEAVSETAKAKAAFTEEDVYQRASVVLEKAVLNGTTRLRTFVEVDPRAGYRSLDAIKRLKVDYAWAIEIEICAFAQEGLTNEPATEAMLETALKSGADLVGGCPYTDPQPAEHIRRIFDLGERFHVPVDFHLDFHLDPTKSDLPEVIAQTIARRYEGRVSVGHVTNLSAMTPEDLEALGERLAQAAIAVTALPATDLFLMGRGAGRLTPRGVAPIHRLAAHGVVTTLSTNNVMNPFTPFGDVSLMRMANLYANIAQIGAPAELAGIFDMIMSLPARLVGKGRKSLEVGASADLVIFDALSSSDAVAQIAPAVTGWKDGRQTFLRPPPQLLREM
ncbi:MAG: amidohydrolase family protein [Roseiarcus sp.]|uniref:amidohydrolase family protein n=1 Tax=Roseiarcus sp. TaxID=1969460 RepID=UPI003BB12E06